MKVQKKNLDKFEIANGKLLNYIVDHNMRHTVERTAILKFITEIKGHFDVDTLYFNMRENKLRVSKATLYNNLEIFLDCGIVVKHQFENKASEYEFVADNTMHHHIVNTQTNKIIEFEDARIDKIKKEMELKLGIIVDSIHFILFAHNK